MRRGVILGLGVSGQAVATYLQKRGTAVVGMDAVLPRAPSFPCFHDKAPFTFTSGDVLIKSPGVSPLHPILLQAKKEGVPITSEIELALKVLSKKKVPLLGLTGSNGKTTTALLTAHVLKQCGKKGVAAGNVGLPLISLVDSELEAIVVELSSFQLEGLKVPAFDRGVILNITPNHLDRYSSYEEYIFAKWELANVLKEGGKLFVHEHAPLPKGRVSPFETLPPYEKVASIFPPCYRSKWEKENCVAAWVLCETLGITKKEFLEGCKGFKKPPHRLEEVGTIGNIHYVNDSKATSVEAVKMALSSIQSEVVWIAGGVDKGGSFADLLSLCKGKVRSVLAIGEAATRISNELNRELHVEIHPHLKSAFLRAQKLACKGDTIILSPGCSSYDQYANYAERGDQFKKYCQECAP